MKIQYLSINMKSNILIYCYDCIEGEEKQHHFTLLFKD